MTGRAMTARLSFHTTNRRQTCERNVEINPHPGKEEAHHEHVSYESLRDVDVGRIALCRG